MTNLKKVIKYYIFLSIIISLSSFATQIEDIDWITEEYPPYNYRENKDPKGVAIEILLEIWKKMGLKKRPRDIKFLPWPRGVKLIQSKRNTCLFSAFETNERKNAFGWKFVTPIPQPKKSVSNDLIAKKNKGIIFKNLDDIRNYPDKFGVLIGDAGQSLLEEAGVNRFKFSKSATPSALIKKLHMGRYDVISYGKFTTFKTMKNLDINPEEYESVFVFPFKALGYAFHQDTDDKLLEKFKKALDELYKEGKVDEIEKKYFK